LRGRGGFEKQARQTKKEELSAEKASCLQVTEKKEGPRERGGGGDAIRPGAKGQTRENLSWRHFERSESKESLPPGPQWKWGTQIRRKGREEGTG